jgi:hypothetical protein
MRKISNACWRIVPLETCSSYEHGGRSVIQPVYWIDQRVNDVSFELHIAFVKEVSILR